MSQTVKKGEASSAGTLRHKVSANLRAHRLSSVSENLKLKAIVNGLECELLNLSETGLAFSANKAVPQGNSVQLQLQFDPQRVIYSGPILIVWEKETSEGFTFGAQFVSHVLSEALPHALEAIGQLYKTLDDTQNKAINLPDEFKVFVAEFRVFLSTLKSHLDVMEERLIPASLEVKNSHKKAVELGVAPQVIEQLTAFNMRLFNMFHLFEKPEDKNAAIEHFQRELKELFVQSPFTVRASMKPLGYAGDYEMMNQVYRDTYEGASLYAQILHKYSINEAATRSIRYRKELIVRKLNSLIEEKKGSLNIASLACGPAREVIDFVKTATPQSVARCSFVLIDQDSEALLNCKRNIYQKILERDLKCDVIYAALSIKDILERTLSMKLIEGMKFDFLYSVGLFDYLSQPLARALTQELVEYVKPGGTLLIGNFHPSTPTRAISEFAIDWKLIYRSEREMMDLVPASLKSSAQILADDHDMDLFVEIKV